MFLAFGILAAAYEPEVIAIGPYHRDKDNLKMMEDHKLRYLHLLLQRKNDNIEKYVSAIGPLEPQARKCYAENINLSPADFIEMLVLDGCFVIELVRKSNLPHLREKNDPIFHMDWIMNSLQRDLMLFENQNSVLCSIQSRSWSSHEIKHLVDLIRRDWLSSFEYREKGWRFINCAAWLKEANVKFARYDNVTLFNIRFENGTIFLAPLTVEDRTDSLFRNLIAYEQYFQDTKFSLVTDYVKFLDCLIDSSRDVQILCRCGVIDNWLGDDEAVANMFNKLSDSVTGPGSSFVYAEIFDSINEHCNKRRNRWMAKLRRNYLNSPWLLFPLLLLLYWFYSQ
ncbi:UNVERIFIED_CONTAM: hypothetical protein Scaly_2614200 [Sesamum calycinum]|uniref:Uncharacterized protein n=1 Tax=Sesamum calycinum TaxID=2727403 RepID=A0AAW2JBG1_9LAMI